MNEVGEPLDLVAGPTNDLADIDESEPSPGQSLY